MEISSRERKSVSSELDSIREKEKFNSDQSINI
jgi:hypothetical protein